MRLCSVSSSARTARRISRRRAVRYRQGGGSRHPRPLPGTPSGSVFCAARAWRKDARREGSERNRKRSDGSISQLDLGLARNRRPDAEDGLHLLLDLGEQRRIVFEIHLRVLATLTNSLRAVAVPRARLVDDARLGRDVEYERGVADALGVHDVELGLLERRCDLVLTTLTRTCEPMTSSFSFTGAMRR